MYLAQPFMDVGITFHCGHDDQTKFTYWWAVKEICPNDEISAYLKQLPYSSCIDNAIKSQNFDTQRMNIYVFSDRYSNTLQFLDDKG